MTNHELKKIEFNEVEANIVFSIAVLVSEKIKEVEKKYNKNRINLNEYIKSRKKIQNLIQKFKKNLEEE